jgi:pantoate--beta-alanine ligase
MARDLNLPIEIVGCPIVREADGLALSSRNRYLSAEERARALSLSRGLAAAESLWAQGVRDRCALEQAALEPVEAAADRVDYVEAVHPTSLEPYADGARCVVLVAAHIGTTRLIDNRVLD